MTRLFLVLVGLSGAACGSKSFPVQLPAPNVSVQEHLAESERHNAQADSHTSAEHSSDPGESPDGARCLPVQTIKHRAMPMSLPSVTDSVSEVDQGIVVTLHSGRDEIAAATLGRLESTLKSAGSRDPRHI